MTSTKNKLPLTIHAIDNADQMVQEIWNGQDIWGDDTATKYIREDVHAEEISKRNDAITVLVKRLVELDQEGDDLSIGVIQEALAIVGAEKDQLRQYLKR